MKDGKIEPIPPAGDDAYGNGFLNKAFANMVINRQNRQWLVATPVGCPTALFMQTEENVMLDLSNQPYGSNNTLWLAVDGIATPFGIRLD